MLSFIIRNGFLNGEKVINIKILIKFILAFARSMKIMHIKYLTLPKARLVLEIRYDFAEKSF